MAHVFNGRAYAKQKEEALKKQVQHLDSDGVKLRVKTFVFREDEGSRIYTKLKQSAAERIGISYEPVEHSINENLDVLRKEIMDASQDPSVTGVMIQKPAKATFQKENEADFSSWWSALVQAIDPEKDVDCLTKDNLDKIKNDGSILPATVQAIVFILAEAKRELIITDEAWKEKKVAIIGRSDIVGKPLSWVLAKHHNIASLFGKSDVPEDLTDYDIVVSAVGVPNLITKVKDRAILIDVGSPKGDVDYESVISNASFITPVPGGVGPVTVICLMGNVIKLHRG